MRLIDKLAAVTVLWACLSATAMAGKAAEPAKTANPVGVISGHRIVITHPIVIKEGGNIDEVLALAKAWKHKVADQIPQVLKTEILLEELSETEFEMLLIYYFENKAGEMEAMGQMGPLIQKGWPEEKARKQFFDDLGSYVVEAKKKTSFYKLIE